MKSTILTLSALLICSMFVGCQGTIPPTEVPPYPHTYANTDRNRNLTILAVEDERTNAEDKDLYIVDDYGVELKDRISASLLFNHVELAKKPSEGTLTLRTSITDAGMSSGPTWRTYISAGGWPAVGLILLAANAGIGWVIGAGVLSAIMIPVSFGSGLGYMHESRTVAHFSLQRKDHSALWDKDIELRDTFIYSEGGTDVHATSERQLVNSFYKLADSAIVEMATAFKREPKGGQ